MSKTKKMSNPSTGESRIRKNLCEMLKKVVLAFCEVNVDFLSRLDIYGSIHVRADDFDITNFVLNEHTYRSQDVQDNPIESLYERHTSDVKGSVSGIVSICRTVCSAESEQDNRQNFTSEATSAEGCCVDQHRSEDNQLAEDSQRLVVQTESSNDYVTERVEQDACNLPNAADVLSARNYRQTNEVYKKRNGASNASVRVNPANMVSCESEAIDLCEDEANISRGPAAKVEQSINEIDTNYFEPDDGSLICERDGTSHGNLSNTLHGFNESVADQYFAGANAANETVKRELDWSQSGFGVKSVSTVCSYCTQSFISVSELSRHIRQMHANIEAARPGRRPCLVSASELATEASFNEIYSCSLCSFSFRSRDGLRCHENSKHSRNKLYHCQYCDQSFLTRQSAYGHRVKFHRLAVKSSVRLKQ